MENNTKEVYFNEYCSSCRYSNDRESSEICGECLDEPYNYDSHKPVNYEEKEK